jgi:hypothetical protein
MIIYMQAVPETSPPPSKSKKTLFVVLLSLLLIIVIGVGVFFILNSFQEESTDQEEARAKGGAQWLFFVSPQEEEEVQIDNFLVANPLDLSQIGRFSKFRSCSGHDYSGFNLAGKKETERSMKHYIQPIDSLLGSTGQIKVFSPFEGKIASIQQDENPRGRQVWLTSPTAGDWIFVFFHIDLLSGLKVGSKVKAGQHLGHGDIEGTVSFDYALQQLKGMTIKG